MLSRITQYASEQLYHAKRMSASRLLHQAVSLGLVVSTALAIWRSLMLATGSESPVVVVLSGSMEPALYRGDAIFLSMTSSPVEPGEIVVFKLAGRDVPIVHRVVHVQNSREPTLGGNRTSISSKEREKRKRTPEQHLLTKGDNNAADDRGLYGGGMRWLKRSHLMGRARGYLPKAGMATILMNDYPALKVVLIAGMCISMLLSNES